MNSLVSESIAMQGTGTDAVIRTVKKVLSIGNVVSMHVDAASSVVNYQRVATQEEQSEREGITYHDIVRAREMEEYDPPEGVDSYGQLFEMFSDLEDAGFAPSVILSGKTMSELRKWIPLLSRKHKKLFGVPVVVEENIPEDILILCGTDGTGDGPEAVKYSIKVTLP